MYTFYCAQLKGEQTKHKLTDNTSKRRARMTMDWYQCDGWLHVTVDESDLSMVCIRITHYRWHHPYTDISISDNIAKEIEKLKDLPAAKVSEILPLNAMISWLLKIWRAIVKNNPKTEITQKQVYAHWAHLHEASWRLDNDQVKSALKVLERVDDINIETIAVPREDGISSLAFSFKDILGDYGEEITEIAMDSTCQYLVT